MFLSDLPERIASYSGVRRVVISFRMESSSRSEGMKCCARGRSTAGYFIREEIEDIIVKGYLVYRASQVGERLRGRPMLMRPETRAMMRRRVGRGWRGCHSEEDLVVVRVCCMGVWSSAYRVSCPVLGPMRIPFLRTLLGGGCLGR